MEKRNLPPRSLYRLVTDGEETDGTETLDRHPILPIVPMALDPSTTIYLGWHPLE